MEAEKVGELGDPHTVHEAPIEKLPQAELPIRVGRLAPTGPAQDLFDGRQLGKVVGRGERRGGSTDLVRNRDLEGREPTPGRNGVRRFQEDLGASDPVNQQVVRGEPIDFDSREQLPVTHSTEIVGGQANQVREPATGNQEATVPTLEPDPRFRGRGEGLESPPQV